MDRESEGIIEGRPSRGVAILWRKDFFVNVKPLFIDDSSIGLCVKNGNSSLFLLNVYMPCDLQTLDALDKYRSMLAKIKAIVSEQNYSDIIIGGDFNADPRKGRFWRELEDFTRSMSFTVLDSFLPRDTFTYLCPAKNTTSWLDHIVCSKNLSLCKKEIRVNYDTVLYDHFPLFFEFDLDVVHETNFLNKTFSHNDEYVNWNRINESDKTNIREKLDKILRALELIDDEVLNCKVVGCKNESHRRRLEEIFRVIKVSLLQATDEYKFSKDNRYKVIPGWNDHVRELHKIARKYFLKWKEHGKPLIGQLVEDMKCSRKSFKNAFDTCKGNEEKIRNEKLALKLRNKKYKEFWKEVDLKKNGKASSPSSIDGMSNPTEISNHFGNKYRKILDKNNKGFSSAEFVFTEGVKLFPGWAISVTNIQDAIRQLKCTIGFDFIHSNHLKFCTKLFVEILAKLFTGFFIHEWVPLELLKGIISPTVKDKHGDLYDSSNYRPVMSSSVFLKLLEYCILIKIKDYIVLNDRQHAYREMYSTSTACYFLKETVLSYVNSNTRVYSCFLDISKAFDSIDHAVLLNKLKMLGIPIIYIKLIKFWYCNQYAKVKFNSEFSDEWKICNGVRQGGVLSGLFFSLYIDSLIDRISKLRTGCRIGLQSSNIIAYADDVVLLAPSFASLQMLLDIAYEEALKLELEFNANKSKVIVFNHCKKTTEVKKNFVLGGRQVEFARTIRYLGYEIVDTLCNENDINCKMRKFYAEFNQILRKFNNLDVNTKLFLFKQYCLQIYGSELWFSRKRSGNNIKQFAVGYHKAIKKILGLSYHESNHYACQEAGVYTFENLMNNNKIQFMFRLHIKPCNFIKKLWSYLSVSSEFFREVNHIACKKYGINDLLDNDIDAVKSRIYFVQNHETPMRGAVEL